MKKYLNQTTVNVIAIASAVAWSACLVGNVLDRGPDKAMKEQMLLNRQLDYDIARLRNCGQLKMAGIQFHPTSSMSFLCADVVTEFVEPGVLGE
tara:strand:- start:294 stop:575 length:282 start_codon:yes stop_codon:yes gene_type:complete